jgi:hypothetical protein
MDENKIARFYKEGRGLGHGREYQPWLTTSDVRSHGRSHRVHGRKTERVHHLLSDKEWRTFLFLDWCDDVTDIREQFPLPREITRRIAERLGVRHPTDNSTRTPIVMTTDFLVDVLRDGRPCLEACFVKPSIELENSRVLEKLEIERSFWAEQNIPLRIFTELEFSKVLTTNLQWLRTLSFDNQSEPWAGYHQEHADAVLRGIPRSSNLLLRDFCTSTDRDLSLERGSTLAIVRHLVSTKSVWVDLTVPLNDHRLMEDFKPRTGKVRQEEVA